MQTETTKLQSYLRQVFGSITENYMNEVAAVSVVGAELGIAIIVAPEITTPLGAGACKNESSLIIEPRFI